MATMNLDWGAADRPELERLGNALDAGLAGQRDAGAIELALKVLRVRSRSGKNIPLAANRAQRAYEAKRGQNNVVLKARQLGMTTWVAGQFFLRTITHPGTLTVQVAHSQESAEAIFNFASCIAFCASFRHRCAGGRSRHRWSMRGRLFSRAWTASTAWKRRGPRMRAAA